MTSDTDEKMGKKKIISFSATLFTGIVLLAQGLKFTVFGLFLFFAKPFLALFFILLGLLGCGILIGAFFLWKTKKFLGGSLIIMCSLCSIWRGFSLFIFLGVLGGVLGLSGKIKEMEREIFIAFLTMLLLSSLVFISGLLHYTKLSSTYKRMKINGRERKYLIHIPSDYSNSEPAPLVLALHGGGGSARSFKQKTSFDRVAENENFIIVYPDGTGRNKYFLHTWNTGLNPNYANKQEINDVNFLTQLINYLKQAYTINDSEIYMTGHSNGAKMTYRFAAEHPEILAGIAPVSGSIGIRKDKDGPPITIPDPSSPLSVIHIHGKKDEYVPYNGGKGKSILGTRYDLSANASVSFWIENNNCSTTPEIEKSKNGSIQLERYKEGENHTTVTLITLKNAGHSWKDMNNEVESTQYGDSLAELIYRMA